MTFTLFNRKKEEFSPFIKGINSVYSALIEGLNKMEKQGVDRVVLSVYESEPSQNATGRWLSMNKDIPYYPFEMLDKTEQGMIKGGKNYTVVALVRDNVGDIVRYENKGLEVYQRTHITPFLPKLKFESELNYVTEGGAYTNEKLRQFAENIAGNGWNPGAIEQRVSTGIQEYHEITRELMEKNGVYDVLLKMKKTEDSPFEQIMKNMRSEIFAAKKR